MKYELTHDTIARQVYQKASTDARTRRKVERYIRERYVAFQDRGVQLTQDDIDYVWPYLNQVNSPEKEIDFLKKGKSRLLRNRRIRRAVGFSITIAFAVLALWALQQRNQAEEREQQSKSMRVSLAARYALYEGQPDLAFRLAEQTLNWNNDENALKIAREVVTEIQANPLVRDVQHQDAITTLQFSLDGTFFLSASRDGEARLSDLYGKVLRRFPHQGAVSWASLLQDDQYLAVHTASNAFYVYDLAMGGKQIFSAEGQVVASDVLRSQSLLAATMANKLIVWDVRDSTEVVLQMSFDEPLSAVKLVSKSGSWEIITADKAGKAQRWDAQGALLTEYPNVLSASITGLSIDDQQEKIVFRTPEGDYLTSYTGDTLQTTTALLFRAFQPNGSAFAGKNTINRLTGFNQDSSLVYVFNFGSTDSDIDMQHSPKLPARCGILSPNGKIILSGSRDNETVVFYIKDKFTDITQTLFRFNNRTDWGVFAPNNAHFLSSDGGNKALLWKLDQEYVNTKLATTMDTIMQYYQSRLRPLSAEERVFYQLD